MSNIINHIETYTSISWDNFIIFWLHLGSDFFIYYLTGE